MNFINKKKIAYATSFGDPYSGTEEEKKISKINLKRFDKISVRDKLSLQITKEIFGLKNVSQVCDPTFICDYEDYEKLITLFNGLKLLILYNDLPIFFGLHLLSFKGDDFDNGLSIIKIEYPIFFTAWCNA